MTDLGTKDGDWRVLNGVCALCYELKEKGFVMNVEEVQDHFKMTDGFNLFYRCWRTTAEIKRVVVCIHGEGDHSGWFKVIGSKLAEDGSQVYASDLRGFGNLQEEGLPRGDTKDFQRHLQDIDETIRHMRRKHPSKKIYALRIVWEVATLSGMPPIIQIHLTVWCLQRPV